MTALSPSVRLKELLGSNLADLPNTPGFQFVGIFRDGTARPCEVKLDPVGCCGAYDQNGDPIFFDLVGWRPLPPNKE